MRRERGLPDDHLFPVPSQGLVRDGYAFHDLTSGGDVTVLQIALSNGAIVTMDGGLHTPPDEVLHRLANILWHDLSVPAEDLVSIIELKVLEIRDGRAVGRLFDGRAPSAEPFLEHVELDSRIFQSDGMVVDFQYLIDFYGEKLRPHRIPTLLELCRAKYSSEILPRATQLYPDASARDAALSSLYPAAFRDQ